MRHLTETEARLVTTTCALTRYEAAVLKAMVFTGLPTAKVHLWGYWFYRQIARDVRRFAMVYLDSQYRLLLDLQLDPSIADAATVAAQVWDNPDTAADVERHIQWVLDQQTDGSRVPAELDAEGHPRTPCWVADLPGYSADLPISGWPDITATCGLDR